MPKLPKEKRNAMTTGKYPSIGMDCKRSMKGTRTMDATRLVAASIPKNTPQRMEMMRVVIILPTVLNV